MTNLDLSRVQFNAISGDLVYSDSEVNEDNEILHTKSDYN
jgi:hypothetical protein